MRAYLQLVRLPAVFTAMADIFLGFLLTHHSFDDAPLKFGLLLVTSSCLYMAGMVFNDVFDREVDARERPNRPIPSERISVIAAVRLGIVLTLAGLGAANVVGMSSLLIAVGLVVGVFAYDGLLKKTILGPLAMGACRFLNVMLGASASSFGVMLWGRPQTPVAICLGVYIAGVTWFARQESTTSSRWHLVSAMSLVNAGLAGLLYLILTHPWRGEPDTKGLLLLFAVIALTIDRRLTRAVISPIPERVQPAIKTLLLSVIMLDAMMIYAQSGDAKLSLMTAALVIPSMILGRWVFMT